MTRQAGYQDVPGFENDFDNPANVLARHRVSIGVDIDQAIQRHLPHARQGLRCDELERRQRRGLCRESIGRPLVGDAVDPLGKRSRSLRATGKRSGVPR